MKKENTKDKKEKISSSGSLQQGSSSRSFHYVETSKNKEGRKKFKKEGESIGSLEQGSSLSGLTSA